MARPPEQAINEANAALGHFELVELGAAVNDLREELEAECVLADQLATALERTQILLQLVLARKPARDVAETRAETDSALAAHRERRDA